MHRDGKRQAGHCGDCRACSFWKFDVYDDLITVKLKELVFIEHLRASCRALHVPSSPRPRRQAFLRRRADGRERAGGLPEVSRRARGGPGLTFRPGSQSSCRSVLGISQHLPAQGPGGQPFGGEQPGPRPPRPAPRRGRAPLFPELERTISFPVVLGREAQGREGRARATLIRCTHAEFGRSLLGTGLPQCA